MKCSVGAEAQQKLRVKIAGDILDIINSGSGQMLDVKSLTEDVYNLIKQATDDHNQALDYARLVPFMVDQLAASDMRIKEAFVNSGIDRNAFDSLILASFKEDTGLESIEKFLGLKDDAKLKKELAALNKKKAAPTHISENQMEMTFDENEGGAPDSGFNKTERKTAEEEYNDLVQEGEARRTGPNDPLSFRVQATLIERIIDGTYDPAQAREILNAWKENRSYNGQPNLSQKQIASVESNINQKEQQLAKEKPTPKKKIEEIKPKPPVQKVNLLQTAAQNIRQAVFKAFQAVAPTFFADGVFEARYGKAAKDQNANRVPLENTKFYYGVKRKLLQLLADANIGQDSSKLVLNGSEGVYLKAVPAGSVEQTPYTAELLKKDPRAVIMVVANRFGEPLEFNEQFEPVLTGGKPAYYALRNVDDIISNTGEVNKSKLYSVAKALADVRGISQAQAEAQVLKEAQSIKDVRDYIEANPDGNIQFKMNGGSFGYIEISGLKRAALSEITEPLQFMTADEDTASEEDKIAKGNTYVTVQDLHGQWIEVERPGVAEAGNTELVTDLILEDMVDATGSRVLYSERRELLRSYINLSEKEEDDVNAENTRGIYIRKDPNDPYKYELFIQGNLQDLESPGGKAEARKALEEMFTEKKLTYGITKNQLDSIGGKVAANINQANAGDFVLDSRSGKFMKVAYKYKMNINKTALNGTVTKPSLQKADNGQVTLTTEEVPYREFLNESKFTLHTSEVASDGKLRRTNAYFTFELTDTGKGTLYPKAAEEKETQDTVDEQKERLDKMKGETEEDPKDVNEDDFLNDVWDNYDKLFIQKGQNKAVTEKQIEEAKAWYANSPLSEYIDFNEMFHAVNKMKSSSIATFGKNGITLFKGSDYTDVYHEAWHGFSQAFMTKEQKARLYAEVGNKKGSFKDYNGHQVTFARATDKQKEEYLAEEFRDYMLNGQKKKKGSPEQNSFFRKIWNALKALFENSSVREIVLDEQADAVVGELFRKLKVGDISEYSYSTENVAFGTLNQGITAKNTPKDGPVELNYENSQVITEMTDNFIAEYVDLVNAKLTAPERKRYAYLKAQLSRLDLPKNNQVDAEGNVTQEGRVEMEAQLLALEDKGTYEFTGRITKDPVMLVNAYKYAQYRLTELVNKSLDDAENETNSATKARLIRDAEILTFARDNFGTLKLSSEEKIEVKEGETTEDRRTRKRAEALMILKANAPISGEVVTDVIGYHMFKTKVFGETGFLEIGDLDGDQQLMKAMRAFDRAGNESSLKELASSEILYLLKTLPARQTDNSILQNRFGVNQLATFQATWNRLARALQNTQNFEEMYQRLLEESVKYPPIQDLIKRMGDPEASSTTSEHGLWTNFWQTFNKTRVPLVQMTVTESVDSNENIMFTSTIGEAFNADYTVGKKWQADFTAAAPGTQKYTSRDSKGNYLNTAKLLEDFSKDRARKDPFAFYAAIGMPLTDVPEIKSALRDNPKKYSPVYFYNKIVDLHNKGERIEYFSQFTGESANKFKDIQILESQNSDLFSNFMVTNAEGNTQFEHSLNNTLTITVNSINAAKDYQSLIGTPHMAHLDIERNPFSEASLWMRSMFHLEDTDRGTELWGTRRTKIDGSPVTLRLTNLSGVLLKSENDETGDGISSASADQYTKLIMDLHLSYAGVPELMRHADKGTSFSVVIDGPLLKRTKSDEHYVPIGHFADGARYKKTTTSLLLPHIIAEMKRIGTMKNLAESDLENYDFDYVESGQKFTAFDNVLTSSTKESLMEIIDSEQDVVAALKAAPSLMADISSDISEYFDRQYENVSDTLSEAEFISSNVLIDVKKKGVPAAMAKEAFIRSYVHNNWIHNLESIALLYGDLAQYNHVKEGFHKRNAGSGSTGTIYRTDQLMQNHINNDLYTSSYAAANAERLGIKEQHMFTGQMHTGIMEDMSVTSAYIKEYEKAGVDTGDYNGQNEADAQGLITFDAYRQLKVAEGSWSDNQEALFQRIVKGETVNARKVNKFFPVVKGQYWGPLANKTGLPVTAFHKYSLFPMIPSVIKNKKMEAVHDRMVKENISYVTFESGSKVGTITKTFTEKNGVKSRQYDKVYANQETGELVPALTDLSIEENIFTKNTINLEYLKNQLEIHDERKGKVIFSTQLRKLIEDGLMESGVPMDFMKGEDADKRIAGWAKLKTESAKLNKSPFYKMLKSYEGNIRALTDFKKRELLDEINWTEGMLEGTEQKDMRSLMDMVQKELTRQDLGQHAIDFIQTDQDGNIKWDLSLSLNVEKIEKLLNAMMVKRLVKQKINGEGLIQVATSLMEDMNAERKFKNATEEDLANYGSNDLPTYRPQYDADGNQTSTTAMKVKVALTGDFLNLLNARHIDGKNIKTIERLNDMLKDEEWVQANREMITMVGVRIPVQGLNSMEFMEIYEFLPAEAGSVIVPPTEIVTKSGADFDVDKMTVMMPSITKVNGKAELYRTGVRPSDTKENLQEEKSELLNEAEAIRTKYDDIFERRDTDQEFAFTPGQLEELNTISAEIQNNKEQIAKTKAEKKVLYKDYKGGALKQMVSSYQDVLDTLYDQKDALYAQKKELVSNSKSEIIKKITADQQAAINPVNERLAQVQRELNSFSQKGIENNIISDIRSILELPENFVSLVTPNSTSILDPLADEMKDTAMDFNPLDNVHGEPRRIAMVKGKPKEVISPTRVLEIGYNMYKHQSNNVGKQTLGLGAVDNTYNTLFNRIGARMNAYNMDKAEYDAVVAKKAAGKEKLTKEDKKILNKFTRQTILMDHNKVKHNGEETISLSHLKDKDGKNSISDVVNQLINGWVDVAADAWIFNIQGNKEVSPTLLFMIQAGVPIQQAVYFVSNPLVREYVKQQRLAQSTFAKALNTAPENPNFFRSHARDRVLTNKDYEFGVSRVDAGTLKELTDKHLGENPKNFTEKQLQTRAKSKSVNAEDRAIFLHFLQLEEMTKSVRDVKMRTNVDTSRDASLFEAQDRLSMLSALEQDGRLPADLVGKIEKDSPIGSFFIQDFQIKLLGDAFPLRNHKVLNSFLQENMDHDTQNKTYGNREKSVTNWKSDLVNHIFQNELRYFDIDKMDYFHGSEIVGGTGILEVQNLKYGAFMKDGVTYVDKAALKAQFRNKTFSSTDYVNDFGLARVKDNTTFTNEQEYIHFVLTREQLRYARPLESLRTSEKFRQINKQVFSAMKQRENETRTDFQIRAVKMAYEVYLRDTALTKTFNHNQLFKSGDTFAHEFNRIRDAYPELSNTFSIMNALSFRESGGFKNLIVNDSSMDGDQLNVLHENLEHLSDPSKVKEILPDANANDITEIVDFFDMFPIVAFLQSGMNTKSSYAMTPFVPQDKMLAIIDQPVKNFTKLLEGRTEKSIELREAYLQDFHKRWVSENLMSKRSSRVRGKYFNSAVTLMDSSSFKALDPSKTEVLKPTFFVSTAFPEDTTDEDSIFEFPTSLTYSSFTLGPASAKEKAEAHPDKMFVYNYAMLSQQGASKGDHAMHGVAPNTFGMPSMRRYTALDKGTDTYTEQPTVLRDTEDGKIHPKVKEAIDTAISDLLEIQKGIQLVFPTTGFGQEMLSESKGGQQYAPQTFLYLSKQLYENFGYLNPQYLEQTEGLARVQIGQALSDVQIVEMNDQAVKEFIKNCNS